jgi:hypothetical protein
MKGTNIIGAHSLAEMASLLKRPRRVMLMVKAGKPVDDFIEQLLEVLEPGDIIIDGGNSLYDDTTRRVQYVEAGARAPAIGAAATQYEIVGVMTDLSTNTIEPELIEPNIYHPLRSATRATALIRMRGNDPLHFSSRLRNLTSALDPTLRLRIVTFSELKRQAAIALRLTVLGVSLVVVTVLLLSAAGIYAMMSFTVSQRRKEIGIRAAMGADAGQLLRSIFTKAALRLAAGVVVGIVLALMADTASDGELLGSFGRGLLPVTAVVMAIVGLFGTIGPARRSLRIQPTEALRAE